MTVSLSPLAGAGAQFFDNNGVPLAGGFLYTYEAGTSTPLATYTSSSGTIANSNPIVLDASGRVPNEIWFTTGNQLKIILQTSSSVQIGSYDNLAGINDINNVFYTAGSNSELSGTFSVQSAIDKITDKNSGSLTIGYDLGSVNAIPRTVESKLQEQVSVLDFGADPTGATDSTAAFTHALAVASNVLVPTGTYRCDSMITLGNSKTLQLMTGAFIQRTTASTSTDPVIWFSGNFSSVIGTGQNTCGFITQNNAPNGVVLIGYPTFTSPYGSNVLWNTLRDFSISGKQIYGQTTGTPDVGLHIQNPQYTSNAAVYFQNIDGLYIQNVNYGLWLHGWANGNTISNLHFVGLGDNGVLGGAAYYDNGSLENSISGCFLHNSPGCAAIIMKQLNNTANGGNVHTVQYSSYKGIISEPGGAATYGIVATDGTTFGCYIEIKANVPNGNNVSSNFYTSNTFFGLGNSYTANTLNSTNIVTTNLTKNIEYDNATGGLNIGYQQFDFQASLTENTQYKLLDLSVNSDYGAIVTIDYSVNSASGIPFEGAGSVTYAFQTSPSGVLTITVLKYNNVGSGVSFCQGLVSSNRGTIAFQVGNNGTGTSVTQIMYSVKVVYGGGIINNLVVYNSANKTTVTGATPLISPISV